MSTSSCPLALPLTCLSPLMSSVFDGSDLEFAFDLVVRDEVGCSFFETEEVDFDLSSVELLFDLFDLRFRRSAGIILGRPKVSSSSG